MTRQTINRTRKIDPRAITVRIDAAPHLPRSESDSRFARFIEALTRFRDQDENAGHRFIDHRTGVEIAPRICPQQRA